MQKENLILKEKEVSVSDSSFDVYKLREDFPILHRKVNGYPLVYFDNAATTQKPRQVIEKITEYYSLYNSNVHRGVHYLSNEATAAYETSREAAGRFLNASKKEEIIFTRGVTEGINLVAASFGGEFLKEGDEVIISGMEHHSNIVPWQIICERKNARLKVIPVDENGEIIFDEYVKLLNERTKIVSIVHVSNSLGTINPVKEVIAEAHKYDIPVMVDGAQAAPHLMLDVQELDADFYAISGHKVYGPTGIGVLYGKEKYLEMMPPYQGGGEMIETVSFEKTVYNKLPYKFEAGTPDIAGGIGLGAALEYVTAVGHENIARHEKSLLEYGTGVLSGIEGIRMIGMAKHKSCVFSFLLGNIHPYDAGSILDKMGIAVRTGFHCTQPVMDFYCIPGTVRASLAMYNTKEEIDRLAEGLHKVKKMLE
jgi:cysteine desulfurase/selenocysteine lyase